MRKGPCLLSSTGQVIALVFSAASLSCHATQHTVVHVRFHAVHELSLVSPGTADTAALRYSTIASRSPADSTVALPLATCRHCFSSGQMALCGVPEEIVEGRG